MIHLTPYKQTPGLCGPVALRVVFAYYGVNLSEEKITDICNATPEEGALHKNLVAAARTMGFSVKEKTEGTIVELKKYIAKKIPVIVGWYAPNPHGDHYSVVYSITDKYVRMVDSESHLKEQRRRFPIERFKELWFDYDNPKNPEEKTFGWFMVITPAEDK